MNLFHCLGCDAAGSVIDLVMKLDGIDFRAAVDQLLTAHPSLCRASELEPKPVDRKSTIPPEQAAQLLERVVELYAKTFGEVDEGGKYLEGRGIADAGLFTQHRIGYAHGTWTSTVRVHAGRSRRTSAVSSRKRPRPSRRTWPSCSNTAKPCPTAVPPPRTKRPNRPCRRLNGKRRRPSASRPT